MTVDIPCPVTFWRRIEKPKLFFSLTLNDKNAYVGEGRSKGGEEVMDRKNYRYSKGKKRGRRKKKGSGALNRYYYYFLIFDHRQKRPSIIS